MQAAPETRVGVTQAPPGKHRDQESLLGRRDNEQYGENGTCETEWNGRAARGLGSEWLLTRRRTLFVAAGFPAAGVGVPRLGYAAAGAGCRVPRSVTSCYQQLR
jgi:hypothetical protein